SRWRCRIRRRTSAWTPVRKTRPEPSSYLSSSETSRSGAVVTAVAVAIGRAPRIVFRIAPRRVGRGLGSGNCVAGPQDEFYAVSPVACESRLATKCGPERFDASLVIRLLHGRVMATRERKHGHRLREALEHDRSHRFRGEFIAERRACALIDQDLPGLCFTAQPRSEVDHASNGRVVGAALVSEGAERRMAARDAHAEIEVVSGLLPLRAQLAKA